MKARTKERVVDVLIVFGVYVLGTGIGKLVNAKTPKIDFPTSKVTDAVKKIFSKFTSKTKAKAE